MERERGNSLPLPSTITKFHRRNAISGPSPTAGLRRSNTSSVSSQAVEEDEADIRFRNEDKKEAEAGRQGQEMRYEEPDEQNESKGHILWHTRRKGMTKRLVWVIFALGFPVLIGYYLPLLFLLRSEYAGMAPSQPGSTSCQEDSQASSGKALRYQVVNHQSIDSSIFLYCREDTNTDTHTIDSPYTPIPTGGDSSVSCPAHPIRDGSSVVMTTEQAARPFERKYSCIARVPTSARDLYWHGGYCVRKMRGGGGGKWLGGIWFSWGWHSLGKEN